MKKILLFLALLLFIVANCMYCKADTDPVALTIKSKGKWLNDVWVPEDKTIVATYKIPDISSGLTFDFKYKRVRPVLALELYDGKVPILPKLDFKIFKKKIKTIGKKVNMKIDFFVGEDFTGIIFSKRWTSLFEISTGIFVAYDWAGNNKKDRGITTGVNFLIIKY